MSGNAQMQEPEGLGSAGQLKIPNGQEKFEGRAGGISRRNFCSYLPWSIEIKPSSTSSPKINF